MTHTTIEDCPELNMRNFTDVDVERLNNWAIKADAEIERLTAESDAYKLDAERYCWFASIATSGEFDRAEKAFAYFNDVDSCTKEELDSAIDTAIAEEAK